ncbi:ral GTPase-activating subunit alpha-1 [Brachionus plicatilis]|uniref:Ral GTPase-activating subunit alpha-1 n=1 Tax=Brachionus plicatilis TaxID=10195 RepID=A0A3M7RUX9_BRAPC|nr:ral GTPase-activating subunit alpha-1 [Brachionus plicatilis]
MEATTLLIISHLLNHLNHYPYGTYGPTKICSSCNEISDLVLMQSSDCKQSDSNNNSSVPSDELSILLFEQPNVQFFSVNNQYLISLVEHPIKSSSNDLFLSDSWQEQLKLCSTACRVIVRDFSGKYCWDCCLLNSLDHLAPKAKTLEIPAHPEPDNSSTQSAPHSSAENFDFQQLTSLENEQIPKDIDLLKNVIDYMNYSSPECRLDTLISIQSPSVGQYSPNLQFKDQFVFNTLDEIKEKLMACEASTDFGEKAAISSPDKQSDPEAQPTANSDLQSHHYFNLCKSFVHQMGFLSREKRQTFNLLHKSAQLLRELKSLDDQTCRETHKIALIYIAKGQQDKQSILSNEKGSKDYNDFLSALAWPVHLETHEGFMGGLQHVSSQLKSAPYYSNSLCEVLFHVSTQMNNANDQNKISKWRHLGNDSVQIIWSEHTKDYDRSILATEFADVIICVYPLSNGLYRVQIIKKASVGFFGPLFDGAILHKNIMAHLVRATAINASRVLLSSTKGYQDFYVHRAHAISNIVNKLTEKQTFEQFVSDVYSPNLEFLARTKCAESNVSANVSSPVMNSSSIAALSATHFDSEKQLVL